MKPISKTLTVLLFFVAGACPLNSTTTTVITYYYGDVALTSPDGSIPFGSVKQSLVKRTIDKNKKTIVELVKQGRKVFDTKLVQIKNSQTFNVSEGSNTFVGTVTFVGESWKWNQWTYNIRMTNGSGTITGEGKLTATGMTTIKYFNGPGGGKTARITETLKLISAEQYKKLEAEL